MNKEIKLWKVTNKDFSGGWGYESRGCIVSATTWQRAKGIALAEHVDWDKNNVTVEELFVCKKEEYVLDF